MNHHGVRSARMHHAALAFTLLALIASNVTMAAVAVARYPAFFLQPGARLLLIESVGILIVYGVAVGFVAGGKGDYWSVVLRVATIFGVFTGTLEIVNIAIEHGFPLAVRGPALQIAFMVLTFTGWGVAAFQAARSLQSIRFGLLAAVSSAGVCMLIAVAAGFAFEFFLAPPEPAHVSTWGEFKRSGWTDARAFGVANALDSALTHLLIAPMVALLLGGLGSLAAQLTSSWTGRSEQ